MQHGVGLLVGQSVSGLVVWLVGWLVWSVGQSVVRLDSRLVDFVGWSLSLFVG